LNFRWFRGVLVETEMAEETAEEGEDEEREEVE
jgi:hypothetical protein